RTGLYEVGDKVVYPHHGAGTVVKKESREVLGQKREYLTIKILHNDMTVQVPCENADQVGLRRVIGEKEVSVVLKALTGGSTEMPKNWNRRFKHNRDKRSEERRVGKERRSWWGQQQIKRNGMYRLCAAIVSV